MENQFPFISVSGSSFEMGYQHGKQAAPLVRKYIAWIEKFTGKPRSELAAAAMRFLPEIRKVNRSYLDEVMGLAEGAQITLSEAMLCQVRGEAARMIDRGCTAFAVRKSATEDGRTLAGQNQDLEPDYADVAIFLKVQPTDGRPKAVMVTFAGQLGYAGMNQHGVANFANALYNFEWQFGPPHYALKRTILEQKDVNHCIDLLARNRVCSAANVMLCDGSGNIASVEVRPEGIALYPDEHPDVRVHTNHYITKEFERYEKGTLADSCPRLARMRQLIRNSFGKLNVERIKAILADHEGGSAAICRHGAAGMHSICGYIADPASGLFHVRRGHGCDGHWQAYRLG